MFRKLKSLLTINGMTQHDLANVLNLSTSALNLKINGRTEFTLKEAIRVSDYFKMSIEDIFE